MHFLNYTNLNPPIKTEKVKIKPPVQNQKVWSLNLYDYKKSLV